MSGKERQDAGQYKYEEMANKVTKVDRRLLDDPRARRNGRDESATPESLVNRVSVADMGSLVRVPRAKSTEPSREASKELGGEVVPRLKSRPSRKRYTAEIETLNYTPKTPQNRQIYDLLLAWCSKQVDNDLPQDVVVSSVDMILEILKLENSTDNEKKAQIEQVLDLSLTPEKFQELLSLSKRISDYGVENLESQNVNQDGIAVVFEDDVDEEDDNDELDDNDDDDSEDVNDQQRSPEPIEGQENILNNEELVKFDASSQAKDTQNDRISIRSVDRYFLRRLISDELKLKDSVKVSQMAEELESLIKRFVVDKKNPRMLENELVEFFDFEHPELVAKLFSNHLSIYYGLLLSSLDTVEAKSVLIDEMEKNGYNSLVDEVQGEARSNPAKRAREDISSDDDAPKKLKLEPLQVARKPRIVDLDSLVFDEGSHLRTSTTLHLPEGAYKLPKKYEEIHIPAPLLPAFAADERLIPIVELPEWAQVVFPSSETSSLNRIQSRVYPSAFNSDENILMCAPTGAGKTNVAMLTVLRALSKYRDEHTGDIDLDAFKIVYIAPLKALVQEQCREFQRRLQPFGIKVSELTGDSNLTKLQISSTQILVTTPEKWDVITRKMSDISYVNLVRLVIIDEIHLLHDERGPVLESIVSRTLRSVVMDDNEPVRLIGLSATLPNYKDVSTFLRVDENKGLFYFDSTYRPCPLAQQFIGINEKRALKRYQAMNEVCYDKILENVSKGHQVIVFVHSRKETFKTAKWIRDKMLENEELNKIVRSDAGSIEILREESDGCKDTGLKDLLPTGFAIHHAGLSKEDRSKSEDLFAAGHVQVLISTATLAWGVNLPAHTVIIKGTNVYSPEKGTWVELSPQDILQMLGRAGRPRYDKSGEGIIITSQDEIQYYLAILNQQLPIESQLMSKLVDNLNAEVVLGTVKSLSDAVNWLGYTYLYVRMLRSPSIYHVGTEYKGDDLLQYKRADLAHSALTILSKNMLLIYNAESGQVTATDLGRISSHYYIGYESMNLYNTHLKSYSSAFDILRIFAQSEEFKYIPIREEEKPEITKLLESTPIPVRESSDDPLAKINVLLQAYISRLSLDGFALMSDMIYITQSAGRLIRALHEIALKKCWSLTTKVTLDFCKMIEKRMWLPNSPFRQFPNVPSEIIRKTESSQMPWSHYFNLTDASEMSQAIRSERYGRTAFELLQKFPKLSVNARCQPITSTLLRVELEILPEWEWDIDIHGFAESFLLIVEDCNGDKILFTDTFLVRRNFVNQEHILDFTVSVSDPIQPTYFISLISDKWLHCEAKVPLVLYNVHMPKKFPSPTAVLSLQPVQVTDLNQKEFEDCFDFKTFNKFQTQCFQALYNGISNVFIGAVKGSGKTVCAELALLAHWKLGKGRAIYVSPSQEFIDHLLKSWRAKFSDIAGGKEINKLEGELLSDLKLLEQSHLVMATPAQLDIISRRWKTRKSMQSIELLILDDCQAIGSGHNGCAYEVAISRMKFVAAQLEKDMRIVALSTPLANGRDFGEWIEASKHNVFNFSPQERVNSLEIHIQSFSINHNPSLILAMTKPAFNLAKTYNDQEKTSLIFVPTRKHCVEIGADFIKHAKNEDVDFLNAELSSLESYLKKVKDLKLREAVSNGIAFFYHGMHPSDRNIIEKLYEAGALSVIIATRATCSYCPTANAVIVLSTQFYEGKEHRYISYPIGELLEMIGSVKDDENSATVTIFTNTTSKDYYKKFVTEPLPLESHLNIFLHDSLINEITTRVVTSRQSCVEWLSYSYFYRRLQLNPSFYGASDSSSIGLSEYLSELVETTVKDLEDVKLVELEENEEEDEEEEEEDVEELTPLNGAMIAAHYNISFITMQTFTASLNGKTKLKSLLEIISAAAEFEDLEIREYETPVLQKIYNRMPIKTKNADFDSPHFKAFVLLQAHFSRTNLPQDLVSDQKFVLERVLNLLYGAIDIMSTEGYLSAVIAMDLSQMIVQAVWDTDNPLKQVPFFDDDILKRCAKLNVETVYDIMSLEDEERDQTLNLGPKEMNKVAEFVNSYPNIDVLYELDLSEPVVVNEDKLITINIKRDEEMDDLSVVAPFYPGKKSESWWVAIGESSTRQLYAIKKTTISKEEQSLNISFSIPEPGHHDLSIWCICDSYVDADKEISFEVDVSSA